jgi:hypothetical protein
MPTEKSAINTPRPALWPELVLTRIRVPLGRRSTGPRDQAKQCPSDALFDQNASEQSRHAYVEILVESAYGVCYPQEGKKITHPQRQLVSMAYSRTVSSFQAFLLIFTFPALIYNNLYSMNIEERSGVTYLPRNLGTVVHDILPDRTNWLYCSVDTSAVLLEM